MKKMLMALAALAMIPLGGCAGLAPLLAAGTAMAPQPPAPLASTEIDDNAVNFALESFDASLYLVDAAIETGRITPGSPQAKSLAALIRKVMRFLGAADAAQRAGQASSYAEAFREAR
jgi:hypothetical protein